MNMRANEIMRQSAARSRNTPQPLDLEGQQPPTVQAWLSIQCGMISGISRGLVFQLQADAQGASLAACWPPGLADTGDQELARRAATGSGKVRVDRVADSHDSSLLDQFFFPVSGAEPGVDGNGLVFVVFLEMPSRPQIEQQSVINLLRWGSEWLKFSRSSHTPLETGALTPVFQMVASCLDQDSFQGMAMTLVTELAAQFGCQRVSLGLRRGKHTAVQVLSHSSRFEHRSDLIRTIALAMDEAVDQDRVLVFPTDNSQTTAITYAHAELAGESDNAGICTLPFTDKHKVIGALTLERNSGQAFDSATIKQIEQLLVVVSPMLVLKRQDEKILPVKVWRSVSETCARIVGPGHLGFKAALVVVLTLSTLLYMLPGTWRVTAEAVIEGSVQRTIAAPIDGYIATATLRAGDVVAMDQELGTLDDSDLKLQLLKWTTSRQQLVREHREAMAEHNRAEISIISSRIAQAEAEQALLEEQLSRVQLVAPFDGIIIEGDLTQLLGTPVARGDVLFKVAPLEDYRIVLKVDEKDIAPIETGQTGSLILASMPEQALQLKIEKITSVSTAEEGRNFFRVEASLRGSPVALRPGMGGIGKIEVGEENLFWIWTRDLVNWLRLQAWTWWR